jgi:DNA-binding Lrp family transcriptional regulator
MSEPSPSHGRSQRRAPLYTSSGLELDRLDLTVLRLLAQDATRTVQDISARIGLSHSAALHRVRRLEASGAIVARVALIDERMFEPWVTFSVDVVLTREGRKARRAFYEALGRAPEILAAREVVGDCDLQLRAALPKAGLWPDLQERLDPGARLIAATQVRVIGAMIKQPSPHPLLLEGEGREPGGSGLLPQG